MINKYIQAFYLKPHSTLFKTIDYLNLHLIKIIGLLMVVTIAYPTSQMIRHQHAYQKFKEEYQNLEQEAVKKQTLFANLMNKQKEQNEKDKTLSQISQSLEQLFHRYHAEVENIQWSMENNRSITITINQQPKTIFMIIHDLTEFKMLRFKELSLTKLNRAHLIQLNATLQLIE